MANYPKKMRKKVTNRGARVPSQKDVPKPQLITVRSATELHLKPGEWSGPTADEQPREQQKLLH